MCVSPLDKAGSRANSGSALGLLQWPGFRKILVMFLTTQSQNELVSIKRHYATKNAFSLLVIPGSMAVDVLNLGWFISFPAAAKLADITSNWGHRRYVMGATLTPNM